MKAFIERATPEAMNRFMNDTRGGNDYLSSDQSPWHKHLSLA